MGVRDSILWVWSQQAGASIFWKTESGRQEVANDGKSGSPLRARFLWRLQSWWLLSIILRVSEPGGRIQELTNSLWPLQMCEWGEAGRETHLLVLPEFQGLTTDSELNKTTNMFWFNISTLQDNHCLNCYLNKVHIVRSCQMNGSVRDPFCLSLGNFNKLSTIIQ